MTPPAEQLFVLDTQAFIYSMFHAVPPMTAPDGRPTNAAFGVTRDLIRLREEEKPTYLVCALDIGKPTRRIEVDPEYKAHRPPAPDDLVAQVPIILEIAQAMNIPCVGLAGLRGRRHHGDPSQSSGREGRPHRPLHLRQGLPPTH